MTYVVGVRIAYWEFTASAIVCPTFTYQLMIPKLLEVTAD